MAREPPGIFWATCTLTARVRVFRGFTHGLLVKTTIILILMYIHDSNIITNTIIRYYSKDEAARALGLVFEIQGRWRRFVVDVETAAEGGTNPPARI